MNAKNNNNFSCVILAAGKGTRMKSAIPKVVHRLAGLPLIAHVAHAVLPLSPEKIVVIVSPETEDLVRRSCEKLSSRIEFAVQNEQLGTGHAVGISKGNLKNHTSKSLVLCGDTPLITTKTLANIHQRPISQCPAQIHRHLPGERDILRAAAAGHIG